MRNLHNLKELLSLLFLLFVIVCPCALALATPMASLVGISELAKKVFIFKEAKFIETLAVTNTVLFLIKQELY